MYPAIRIICSSHPGKGGLGDTATLWGRTQSCSKCCSTLSPVSQILLLFQQNLNVRSPLNIDTQCIRKSSQTSSASPCMKRKSPPWLLTPSALVFSVLTQMHCKHQHQSLQRALSSTTNFFIQKAQAKGRSGCVWLYLARHLCGPLERSQKSEQTFHAFSAASTRYKAVSVTCC